MPTRPSRESCRSSQTLFATFSGNRSTARLIRTRSINHHVAFYTITSTTVRILRVLHERMDEEHL